MAPCQVMDVIASAINDEESNEICVFHVVTSEGYWDPAGPDRRSAAGPDSGGEPAVATVDSATR
jgi:hypothetical protein